MAKSPGENHVFLRWLKCLQDQPDHCPGMVKPQPTHMTPLQDIEALSVFLLLAPNALLTIY